jgi:predicted deacetylase
VPPDRTIAVALHDVEPATFERCATIREWLEARGVDRVTLLVIPARDLHPVGERSPELVEWLATRRRLGDAIAQHGFQHEQLRRPSWPQHLSLSVGTRRAAEFMGLDDEETRRAVESGWRLLKLAGIEPDGFVAPAYAYTPALRDVLSTRFRWWASQLSLQGAHALGQPTSPAARTESPDRALTAGDGRPWRRLAPAWRLSGEGPLERALTPVLIRTGPTLAGNTLRLDLHPCDLQRTRHMQALEWALAHTARRRTAVTYDQLAAGQAARRSDGAARLSIGLAAKL